MLRKLKSLLCLGVTVLAIYSGFMFGLPYYRFYAFRSDARDVIKFSARTTDDMRANLLKKAREYGVPLGEAGMEVSTVEGGYWARLKWTEEVDMLVLYHKTLAFSFEAP